MKVIYLQLPTPEYGPQPGDIFKFTECPPGYLWNPMWRGARCKPSSDYVMFIDHEHRLWDHESSPAIKATRIVLDDLPRNKTWNHVYCSIIGSLP